MSEIHPRLIHEPPLWRTTPCKSPRKSISPAESSPSSVQRPLQSRARCETRGWHARPRYPLAAIFSLEAELVITRGERRARHSAASAEQTRRKYFLMRMIDNLQAVLACAAPLGSSINVLHALASFCRRGFTPLVLRRFFVLLLVRVFFFFYIRI